MIEISFLFGELLLAALWLLVRGFLWLRRGRIDWRREAALLLFYFNLAVILRMTFYPYATVAGHVQPLRLDPTDLWPPRINLIPFVRLLDYAHREDMLLNVLGNLALFIPSGILLSALFRRLDSFGKVIAAGAGLSLCVEILQLPFRVRASDVDDLICNTLGCAVSFGVYALFRGLRRGRNGNDAEKER